MNLRAVLLSIAVAGALAACASASRVMISDPRPPIAVEQVRVYLQPPAGRFVEIALLDADSGFTYGAQARQDAVMQRLRVEAAKLGANGVLVQHMGERPSDGGVGIGIGGGGRHVGGGISVGVSPPKQTVRAVAIWVPDAPTP